MLDALLRMRWLGKAVRIAVAVLLVATVADLLAAGTSRFSWATDDPSLPDLAAKRERRVMPGEVVLTIGVAKQRLTASYRVVLPKTEPLFQAVQRGEAAEDTRGLLRVLGVVEVASKPIAFRTPSVTVEEGTLRHGIITLPAEPVTLAQQRSRVEVLPPESGCCLPPPRMVINTDGAQVLAVGPPPLAQSAKRTVFSGAGVTFDLLDPLVRPGKKPGPDESSGASPRPEQPDRYDYWSSLVVRPQLLPASISLTLRVSKQVFTATYVMTIDREQELLTDIQSGQATDRTQELVGLLGRIEVNDKALEFSPPSVTAEEDQPLARVTMHSEPLPLAHRRPLIEVARPARADCCVADRKVVIETKGALVEPHWPPPVAQSADQTVFTPTDGKLSFGLVLVPFDADLTERQQVATLLRALNRPLPVLGWMLYWAVMSLPVFLFLIWHQRRELDEPPPHYVNIAETLLIFFLVLLAGSALAEVAARWPPALALAWVLNHVGLWARDAPRPNAVGGPVLILLAAGFVWPLVAWQRDQAAANLARNGQAASGFSASDTSGQGSGASTARTDSHRRRLRSLAVALAIIVPILGVLLVVAGSYLLLPTTDRYLLGPMEVANWTRIAALVLVVLLLWICRELGITPPGAALTGAVAVIITLAVLSNLSGGVRYPRIVDRVVVTVVCFVLAASLLRVAVRTAAMTTWPAPSAKVHQPTAAAPAPPSTTSTTVLPADDSGALKGWARSLGHIIYQAVTGIDQPPSKRRAVWLVRGGLAILLLLLVSPNPRWSGQQFEVVSGWYARELADWLIHAVYLAFAAILVLCLRDLAHRTDQPGSRPAGRHLCFLLLVIYVLDPGGRIFYFPLTVAAGWFTFSWLLPAGQATLVDGLRGVSRWELVQAAVAAGRERRAYRARRKDLLAKVGSGEITRADYRERLDVLGSPSQAARIRDWPGDQIGMLLGPLKSAWENGVLLARYSFWISVPWVLAVYLRQEFSGALQNREFLVAALLLPLLSNVLQWPVIGFVFGYLYPYVRGANGLSKGLSIAGALIVPLLLINLAYGLIGDNSSWPIFLYWALQVFVTCVSTGFLADLATLREYGRGWTELSDVHNFSALAAWGSSVVAASAGGLITLLQTTIGEFIKQYTAGGGAGPAGR
jgi:hypothetical protein